MQNTNRFLLTGFLVLNLLLANTLNAQSELDSLYCEPSLMALVRQIPSQISDAHLVDFKAITQCNNNQLSIHLPVSQQATQLTIYATELNLSDDFPFFGLANYFNAVNPIALSKTGTVDLENLDSADEPVIWQGFVGRFNAGLLSAPAATVQFNAEFTELQVTWPANTPIELIYASADKYKLAHNDPVFSSLPFNHLWSWLAGLCKLVKWSIIAIQGVTHVSWGWALVIFAVLAKLAVLPLSIGTLRLQRQVSKNQALLAPTLESIKREFDGEEAHQRIMQAHKDLGITPFYALKPLLGTLIQLPILMAIFNALGEMPQFVDHRFLWIPDLAYPDALSGLPFAIPLLGNSLNLLPFLMTLVTILSTLLFQNQHAPEKELKRQKRNLFLMSFAFFILFYPFPAVMVLYWTLANLLHILQQHLIKM